MTSSLQTDLNNWLGWLAAPLGGLEGTTLNWFNTYITGRRHFLNLCTYYFGKHDNLFDILQGHFLALNGFMCICFNFVKWLVIIMWINILRLMTLVFTCSARWLGCTEYYYRLPFQYRTGNFSLKLNENKTEMFIISTSEQRQKSLALQNKTEDVNSHIRKVTKLVFVAKCGGSWTTCYTGRCKNEDTC